MRFLYQIILGAILLILPFLDTMGQTKEKEKFKEYLCKEWKIDSLLVNDINKKFLPPENIKENYITFNENGTFNSQDMGTNLSGKWRFDVKEMKIINSDFNHPALKEDIVFNVLKLTQDKLVITSKPMSGGQVTLYYKPAKNNDTTTKAKNH